MEEGEYYDGWCLIPCNSNNSIDKMNTGNVENSYINPIAESQAKEVNLITEKQTSDANNPPITDCQIKEANLITEDQTNEANHITEHHPKEANLIIEDQLNEANSILEDQTSHASYITENQTTDDFITKRQTNDVNHFTIDQNNENSPENSSSIAVIDEEVVSPYSYKNDATSSFATDLISYSKLLSREVECLRKEHDQSVSDLITILERPFISHPNIPRKRLPQVVNVSTNTEPQVNQRMLDGSTEQTMKKNTENCKLQKKIHIKKDSPHLNLLSINDDDDDYICLPFMTVLISCGIIILTMCINISMKTNHNLQLVEKSTNLQMENNLLKKHMFYSEKKENRKLSSMSRIFFDILEKRENASKYLQLESSYQKEINQLKEQVSLLKANYTILQSHLTPGISPNMQHVIKEKAQFYIDTNINLKRFSELIILLSRQMNDGGYKSEIDCIGDFVKKTVSSVKSFLTKYSLSDDLTFIKNYISERGYISLFSEFMNGLNFADSHSLEKFQQVFVCIKEANKIREYKSKIEKIKINFSHLLGELEELKES